MKARLISGLLMACPLTLGAGLLGCNRDACTTDVQAPIPNPRNGHNEIPEVAAQMLTKDCGFPLGKRMVVRLVDHDGRGIGAKDGEVFIHHASGLKMSVRWDDASHLLIQCNDCEGKEAKRDFVTIEYGQID